MPAELNLRRNLAPWTSAEVASINHFQNSGVWHPFTCLRFHPGTRLLVATHPALVCVECDHAQYSVPGWAADNSWRAWASTVR